MRIRSAARATLLAMVLLPGAGLAQSGSPITARDVTGQWVLRIEPAERRGFGVTIQSDSGGRPDLPLVITAPTGQALTCSLGGDPAECRLIDGKLVITSAGSGGARMIFTLGDRSRGGFRGEARMRARLIPFGGALIGSVDMTHR